VASPVDREWEELARDLARRVDVVAPGWTDYRGSDPGITLAELIAFLGESILYQPARSRAALTRLNDVITTLDTRLHAASCQDVPRLTRVRYFHGQLLSAADFQQEQDYVRNKQRRHNLLLHGVGIVNGLDVTVAPGPAGDESLVEVSPGLAIGQDGEELLVCERMTSPLRSDQAACFVTLRLVDRLIGAVPTTAGEEASRAEETVEVGVFDDVPESHFALARVERTTDSWRLDPGFKVPRSGVLTRAE